MKHPALLVLLFLPVLTLASEKAEPPLGYTLKIGDEKVRIEAGRETEISGQFENPKVMLVPDNERHFTYAGVSFKYPSYFTFEADHETPGIKIWTMSGNDFVLMVQHLSGETLSVEEFAEAIKSQYGKSSGSKLVTRRFNGQTYEGVRVTANMAGTKIIQDVLPLPTAKGSRFFLLQDLPAKEKMSEEEADTVLGLLESTLTVSPMPESSPELR